MVKSIWTFLCSSKLKSRCHYDCTYLYKRRQKAVCCSLLSSISSMSRSGELVSSNVDELLVTTSVRNLSRTLQPFSNCPSRRLVTWLWSVNVKGQLQWNHDRVTDGPLSVEEGGLWNSPDIKWNNHPWVPKCYELSSQHPDCTSRLKRNGVPFASSCP
jgi:hypothetical protein